ncbi:UDP-N-acetylglucosamine transferase subunit ALG14 [Pseudoalteromonas xiamenensis]|uniref:PssD/Cps14F family polysaccharide biosynthesis glycosyltransferase n=1 Tax=Pseudoalteromonas xiamenensis TaxID=882626 RepID=UPI0027E4BEA6|nr:PssD/Cps14F family polysaccharide biosynthesis glycosyltransferase [Pseudoalteromonas xiamenensis]WMN61199.1 UDP-N-acetylglucosamine transferase subunit ALG14 [Pseudoalteromonas xiamenensis]
MSKQAVVILLYGEGGHKMEMSLLFQQIANADLRFISIGPSPISHSIKHFHLKDVRDKQSRFKSLLMAISGTFSAIITTFRISHQYDITGLISTGPGVAIIPSIIVRLLGKKVVFIETFCRFYTRSFTGRIMSKLCTEFWVQNKAQLTLYRNAKYCGRL